MAGTVWTAAVEFQFYLIAPFLFVFVRDGGIVRFILPAIALFWCLRFIVLLPINDHGELFRISYFTILGRINQFLMGITLAYLVDGDRLRIDGSRKGGLLILSSSLLTAMMILWIVNIGGGIKTWHGWHLIFPELEGFIWAVFIYGYLTARPLASSPFLGGAARKVGILSFGLYILHYSVQSQIWARYGRDFANILPVDGRLYIFIASLIILAVSLGLAWLSYRCIEEPFLSMRVRYLTPREKV